MNNFIGRLIKIVFSVVFLLSCESKKDTSLPANAERAEYDHEMVVAFPRLTEAQDHSTLSLNAKAPDFRLPGVDNRYYTLESFKNADVLVVIFMSNQCPTSQAYEEVITEMADDYRRNNVQFVGISPNSVLTSTPEDMSFSEFGDSFEEMKLRALEKNFNFPYLYDGDLQQASVSYGPSVTPQAFVFDRDRRLKYTGALDGKVARYGNNADDLRAVIDAVILEVEILMPIRRAVGCSINWAWETDRVTSANRSWHNEPVFLNQIDTEGISELLENNSDRLMLIDVWAVWNSPSDSLYSEMIDIYRIYRKRNLDFVSISIDSLKHRDRVMRYLNNKNAAGRNFIFSDENYRFIPAGLIDPEWNGLLPYAVLTEPGGKVILRMKGLGNTGELRKAIVEHSLIGRIP